MMHFNSNYLLILSATPFFLCFVAQLLHGFELDEPILHPPIDKRSSEEYEEFIKGSGRFPMGFGKRSSPSYYVGRTPTLSERFLLMKPATDFGNARQFIIAAEGIPIVGGGGWQGGP